MNQSEPTTLEFENGVAKISLPTLKRTVAYEDARGNLPKVRPIEHVAMLEMIHEMIRNKGISIEEGIDPIYAAESQSMRIGHKDKDQLCPVEKFLIQRIVTKVNFRGNDELNPAIAVSYTESGIMVSFGVNVRVCTNLSVFGENLWSTFGPNKVPFEKGMEVLAHWLENFNTKVKHDLDIVEKMKQVQIDSIGMDRIIGRLIRNAVLWNSGDKSVNAPLNVTQVHRMIEEGHKFFNAENRENVNLWEMTNFGTAVLKPESADMVQLLKNNQSLNNFMLETFQLN